MILALALLLGITLHEAAHAWVAELLGDCTAAELGRCSLLPWRHADFLGSVVVPFVLWWWTGAIAGWGRPVPLNRERLGRSCYLLALAAGPASNLLLAVWLYAFGLTEAAGVNVIIAGVNLLPLPPLDGGRIAQELIG
jgi:Zn-dependent protease